MSTRILSRDDPRVSGFLDIKDGERIRKQNRFVAESRPVVAKLVRLKPELVESVLASPQQWLNLQREVDPWPAHIAAFIADKPILAAIAGFPIHRGCLALAACPPVAPPEPGIEGSGWWLGMEGISDHDNVGSLLRTAHVLGARGVMHDPACADPLYRRAVRVSMGASFLLPRWVAPWPELVAQCRASGIRTAALTPAAEQTLQWGAHPFEGPRWAIWVGAEGSGLSAPLLQAADLRLRIPMADGVDSLNVAVAAGLAAWAFRGSAGAVPADLVGPDRR